MIMLLIVWMKNISQGNVYNASIDLTCNSSGQVCLPSIIADEYWVKVIENTVVCMLLINHIVSCRLHPYQIL